MKLIFNLVPFVSLRVFIEISKAEDGLDLNVFQQHDYQIKFERVELLRYNKDLLKDVSIVTFKHNRTTAVVNVTYTAQVDLGNNLDGIMQAYKFMSNEYRHFPMRFSINICKALVADVFGLSRSMKCGNFTGCPIIKGKTYHVCNWYPDQSKFPPLLPNGQYRVEVQVLHFSTEVGVLNVYITVARPTILKN